MTKQEAFAKLTEEYHKYRESVKAGFRTLDPESVRNLASGLIVAGSNPKIIQPDQLEKVFGLAHIGVMDIISELEKENEQVPKAV